MEFTSFAYELEMFLLSPSFFESLWRNNIVISEYNIIYSLLLNILFVVPTTYSSPDIIIFTSMLPFAKIQIQNVHSPPNITIFARLRLASNDHSTIHWIRPCKIKKSRHRSSEQLALRNGTMRQARLSRPRTQRGIEHTFRLFKETARRGFEYAEEAWWKPTLPERRPLERRPPTRTPVWAAKFIHSPGTAVSRVAARSRIHHERAWPGPMATR